MCDSRTAAECRESLAALIKEHALRFGDFTLASGQKSTYFIDGKMVTLQSEGLYCLSRCILEMIERDNIEAVGGMSIGADPITGGVVALAGDEGIPLLGFLVRKEQKDHGTRKQIEGPVPEGARVVMLEDVVTTGGSTLDAIAAVEREKQAQVVKVIAMVDRLQGARENLAQAGYALEAIFTIEELGVVVSPG
ncbi:MAG: orotate phosphoribosyltransferase [Armatimonadetes bacterium]|nr:orotate phosphoribosyltransferase [Armatimonadota bacterium]